MFLAQSSWSLVMADVLAHSRTGGDGSYPCPWLLRGLISARGEVVECGPHG